MTAPVPCMVNAWSTPKIMLSIPCLDLKPKSRETWLASLDIIGQMGELVAALG